MSDYHKLRFHPESGIALGREGVSWMVPKLHVTYNVRRRARHRSNKVSQLGPLRIDNPGWDLIVVA
jgi:hypothetical protein